MTSLATGTAREPLRVVVTGPISQGHGLRESLGEGFDVACVGADVRDVVPHLDASRPDAVLMGMPPRAGEPFAPSLASDVATIRRHTDRPVILLVGGGQPDALEVALAAGVDDVLVLPQAPETIAFSIRKALSSPGQLAPRGPDAGERRGLVVTVFSPKGGTGKTVVATNLAALLAARSGKRVLLIDLDLQFGDAAIMLGLDPQRTIHELVLAPGELDADKLRGYTTRHRCGLEVLAAPTRPEQAELVTEPKVLRLLEVARDAYDLVVVDTSPFFYGPMLAVLRPTDRLLLLCGLDVPTLKNVKLSLRTLEQLGFPETRTSLVLNRVTPKVGLRTEDVESALGVRASFEIPNDPAVAPCVNRGAATVLAEEPSPFSVAIALVAGSLDTGEPDAPAAAAAAPARRRLATARRLLEGRA